MPYIFTISLLRFDYDWQQDARVKINDRVSFSETLNMAPYLQAEEEPPEGGAGGAGAEEEEGYQVREGGGRILARGSSAVLEDKMEYELFAICVHAGGAHGGHYFAYCKPFGDTVRSFDSKLALFWGYFPI